MLAGRWREFRALVQQCNTMNSTNGAIITARRQQVLAGLALLRGHEAAVDTYGVAGARLRAMGGRELAEA
jgi:flagellar biosynthesis/type III secretory pathway chaperone